MFHIPAHKDVEHPAGQVAVSSGPPSYEVVEISWKEAFDATPVVGTWCGLPVLGLTV